MKASATFRAKNSNGKATATAKDHHRGRRGATENAEESKLKRRVTENAEEYGVENWGHTIGRLRDGSRRCWRCGERFQHSKLGGGGGMFGDGVPCCGMQAEGGEEKWGGGVFD